MNQLDKGVWLDEKEAWIAFFDGSQVQMKSIDSEVEDFHLHGGYGTTETPYRSQDTVSETGLLRRKKGQMKTYLQHVLKEILPVDRLYIMGPAQTKVRLEKAITESKNLTLQSVVVEAADKMTQNQFKAKVNEFFRE